MTRKNRTAWAALNAVCCDFAACKGFRNPGNFWLWNPESCALESAIQLKESGIPLTSGIQDYPGSGAHGLLPRFPYMGRCDCFGTVRYGKSLIEVKIANQRATLEWCWSTAHLQGSTYKYKLQST